jgi:hypothetical protein
MAIAIGEEIANSAVVGSVLFVGDGGGGVEILAQDNDGFFFEASTNTLKTADKATAASSSLSISTGDITGTGQYNSGSVVIDTGNGSTNTASLPGGQSGSVTITTGVGGGADSGLAGSSGNLLLKTGNGGTSNTGNAGSGGNIIIQPGTSGGGVGGTGGSTLVRAPANVTGNIFAVQDDTGSTTYWSVSSTATLTGARPFSVSHSTIANTTTFAVTGSGAKTAAFNAADIQATATSSTASITKTGLSVQSTGTWNGSNAVSRALHCNATGGANNYAAIFENGNVGVNTTAPTARLHIAGGTTAAGTAPLKFTSGSLMSTTEAGAIEWDGSKLYITSGTLRKELTNVVANVLDFGAKGDGSTNDAPAFQAAVDSLISTGGVVWAPPNLKYKLDSSISIRGHFPIFIVSEMGRSAALGTDWNQSRLNGYITPGDTITNGLFRWFRPALPGGVADNGGGGLIGVVITDKDFRDQTVDAAVYVEDGTYFWIQRCLIMGIKGRALRIVNSTICQVTDSALSTCGNSGNPSQACVDVGDGTNYAGLYMHDSFLEGNYFAPYIRVNANSGAVLFNTYFEKGDTADQSQKFVTGSANLRGCTFNGNNGQKLELTGNGNFVEDCTLDGGPTSDVPTITMSGSFSRFIGNYVAASAFQTGKCIEISGSFSILADNQFTGTGSIAISAPYCSILGNIVQTSYTTESAVIKVANENCRIIGNQVVTATVSGVDGIGVTHNGCLIIGNRIDFLTGANSDGINTTAAAAVMVRANYIGTVGGMPINVHSASGEFRSVGTRAKVGATAGWVVGAADNLGYMATLPASQTGSTLVIPIDGLKVGDTILGYWLVGQVESSGNTVTLDCNLRKLTATAAEPVDTSVSSMTQISVTADTKVDAVLRQVTGGTEVVGQDETFYLLVTGTTAASTDVILMGAYVSLTPN